MKQCVACGMPMESPEDFAMGDPGKEYCRYCCHPGGTMQSYDEKLASLTDLVIKTQGLDEKTAKSVAKAMMAELPAWRNK